MSTETPPPAPNTPAGPPAPILPVPDAEAKLRAIAEKQGTLGKSTYENLLGAGADLWDSDEEFERFLEFIRESRKRG